MSSPFASVVNWQMIEIRHLSLEIAFEAIASFWLCLKWVRQLWQPLPLAAAPS